MLVPCECRYAVVTVALASIGVCAYIFLFNARNKPVPIINYHSVCSDPSWHPIGELLSVTPRQFEWHLRYLRAKKYVTLSIPELYRRWDAIHDPANREKYIALTFDDGYRDNWHVAFPLLKQYGVKATIFISHEFIAHEQPENGNGSSRSFEGYLTWEMIREMTLSGLIEFASHGSSHSRVFYSDACLGFHRPGYANVWLFWNAFPEKKTRWWRCNLEEFAPYGTPLYPQAPALAAPKFSPHEKLNAGMQERARALGGDAFSGEGWERCMFAWYREIAATMNQRTGVFETEEEYRVRIREELLLVKSRLEAKLAGIVQFLCWPENCFSAAGLAVAGESGYLATVSNFFSSVNGRKDNRQTLGRFPAGSRYFGIKNDVLDFLGFYFSLKCFEGYYIVYPLLVCGSFLKKILFSRTRSSGPFID